MSIPTLCNCIGERLKSLRILQQLFNLWIVFRFNLLIVDEVCLLTLAPMNLTPVAIEDILVFLPRNVVYCNVLRNMGLLKCFWLSALAC